MLILTEATRAIRRTPLMSVMTAFAVALAIGLGGGMWHLSNKARSGLDELRSHVELEAYFGSQLTTAEAHELATQLLAKHPEIKKSEFISREQALEMYDKASGENVVAVLGFNPLPASLRILLNGASSDEALTLKKQLTGAEGVAEVRYDPAALRMLEERENVLQRLTVFVGGMLLLSAIGFVASTTRLAIQSRQETLRVMRLLGASSSALYTPYIIEGGTAGFLGGGVGAGLFLLLGKFALVKISPDLALHLTTSTDLIVFVLLSLLGGLALGALTSGFAAWRVIRTLGAD